MGNCFGRGPGEGSDTASPRAARVAQKEKYADIRRGCEPQPVTGVPVVEQKVVEEEFSSVLMDRLQELRRRKDEVGAWGLPPVEAMEFDSLERDYRRTLVTNKLRQETHCHAVVPLAVAR